MADKNDAATKAATATVTSPTDRGDGIADTAIATDGDTPAADPANDDRSDAGEAREGGPDAPSAAIVTVASLDASADADIAPATEFEPSGAPVQTTDIDLGHASVDANPRANTTVDQNRIDFNDPVRTGAEIVADRLQG